MTGYRIRKLLSNLYERHSYLLESEKLSKTEKACFERMKADMSEEDAALALYQLSDFLYRYYGKEVIILLDEYDTPMQESYVNGYWEELTQFTGSLFNAAFKTNQPKGLRRNEFENTGLHLKEKGFNRIRNGCRFYDYKIVRRQPCFAHFGIVTLSSSLQFIHEF